jgi:hypothetical protein
MQRISTATKAVDLYGAGKHGFKNGNLPLGITATDLDADWCNGLQEEIVGVIEASGLAPSGAALNQLNQSIRLAILSSASSAAGGTADAITASYTPAPAAWVDGMTMLVRANAANATTTPTFTPNAGTIAPKTIVKGAGAALAAGDIAGAGHWIELQYDATLDKLVLQNPATGVSVASVPDATTAVKGKVQLATGSDPWTESLKAVTMSALAAVFGITGAAPAFACRAWVNFNGTGAVSIRSSGNVTSITDNAVGDYTVNFLTALPDSNFSVQIMSNNSGGDLYHRRNLVSQTASSVRVTVEALAADDSVVCVAVAR